MSDYRHRIAFGTWINDMRNESLPLDQWPSSRLDDTTVEGISRTLETAAAAGYGYMDVFGLYATVDYPPDIVSAFGDAERNRQVERVFAAADAVGIKMVLSLGVHTWGYDRIIREDPSVRGVDSAGNPHPHAMCGAQEKSWEYIDKLIDTMFSRHDFGGVHLESADLGYCECPKCAGQYGTVVYNARLNARAAEKIRRDHPGALTYACPINWAPWRLGPDGTQLKFSGADLEGVIELSRGIDLFMDQGHRGRFIDWADVPSLECDYGTSGGLWMYHGARQDRLSYLLPYVRRTAGHLRDYHAHGARGCLFYQGPMINPAVEANSACAGRLMQDVNREPEDVLLEVVEAYYGPKSPEAAQSLVQVFFDVEESYFGQWDMEELPKLQGVEPPGEMMVGTLFNTSPDATTHVMEPYLDAAGRAAHHKGLRDALGRTLALRDQFADTARIDRITRALGLSIQLLATAMMAKGEKWMD